MRPLPLSLQVIAYLFFLSGVGSLVDVLLALLSHRININLGVLTIFIGIGLLRRNPRSHSWALFVTWLTLAGTTLLGALFLVTPGTIQFFGRPAGLAPPGLGFLLSVGMFALVLWQLKVLSSANVRAVFDEELDVETSD